MRLRVLFFGILRDRFGQGEILEHFAGCTVADVLRYYRDLAPDAGPLWTTIAVAVNEQYAQGAAELQNDDEVSLLPPVSGGRVEAYAG